MRCWDGPLWNGVNTDYGESGVYREDFLKYIKADDSRGSHSNFMGLPDEKQPGTHVRRINGKELNDEEMIEYYSKLVNEYGGKLTAKWVYGMVIYDGKETNEYSWSKGHFYFIDKPCEKRNPGYPLDSISIMPECNKYFVDLTEEDKNKNQKDYNEDDVIEFIVKNLKKL